jgi:hypothetical protein
MPDLEDFDLERTPDREGTDSPYRPEPPDRRRGMLFPTTLALAALVALGLLAVLFFVFRSPKAPAPAPPPAATAPPVTEASPSPTPPVALPPLAESDGFVRQLVGALSSHAELARWLQRTGLVRTVVVVTVNVASGESPRPNLLFLAPKQRYRARTVAGALVPDPAGFAGYDAIADALASVDPAAGADAYRTTEPLFDSAFEEFGQPGVRFRSVLDQAVAALLAVPAVPGDANLVPHATVLQYADPGLERLTPAQKQLLRMGPRNVRVVQGWLRDFAAALGLSSGSARR